MPRVLSWYPFAPADYRADTRHLTREQHHAYRETLDEIFLTGQEYDPPSIPDDKDALYDLWSCRSEDEYAAIRTVLIASRRALLSTRNGRISQKRMTAEIAKGLGVSEKRKGAALKRWGKDAPDRSGSTNGHGEVPEHGGNGHGAPTMSEAQFLFYATRVGKFMDDKRDLYHEGSSEPGSAFALDFERSIGISWQRWQLVRKSFE